MAPATEKSAPHGSKRAVRAPGPGHLSAECPSAIHNDHPPVTEGLPNGLFPLALLLDFLYTFHQDTPCLPQESVTHFLLFS